MPNELIEAGDPRTKVVGRRKPPSQGEESLQAGSDINELFEQLSSRKIGIKRGVYRFKSHEEADAWMIKHTFPIVQD